LPVFVLAIVNKAMLFSVVLVNCGYKIAPCAKRFVFRVEIDSVLFSSAMCIRNDLKAIENETKI